MTYRNVPARALLVAQLSTLLVTAIVGWSLYLTPHAKDAKLTVLERGMNQHYWAYALMVAGITGFIFELLAHLRRGDGTPRREIDCYLSIVAWSHVVCCGVMAGYSAAALASVIKYQPWNFGGPALGVLIMIWHGLYVKRRKRV